MGNRVVARLAPITGRGARTPWNKDQFIAVVWRGKAGASLGISLAEEGQQMRTMTLATIAAVSLLAVACQKKDHAADAAAASADAAAAGQAAKKAGEKAKDAAQ